MLDRSLVLILLVNFFAVPFSSGCVGIVHETACRAMPYRAVPCRGRNDGVGHSITPFMLDKTLPGAGAGTFPLVDPLERLMSVTKGGGGTQLDDDDEPIRVRLALAPSYKTFLTT